MSGGGSPTIGVNGEGLRVAIVAASWHDTVMDGLIAGAARACQEANVEATLIRVPGSFELPVVAQACAESPQFDAVVCLGVIIRGGTPHFEFVSQRGDRRAHAGRARHAHADRVRRAHVRRRPAGARPGRTARLEGGQGQRGGVGGDHDGRHAPRPPGRCPAVGPRANRLVP